MSRELSVRGDEKKREREVVGSGRGELRGGITPRISLVISQKWLHTPLLLPTISGNLQSFVHGRTGLGKPRDWAASCRSSDAYAAPSQFFKCLKCSAVSLPSPSSLIVFFKCSLPSHFICFHLQPTIKVVFPTAILTPKQLRLFS